MDKIKFDPQDDLVDQAFSQFKENSINNQDPHIETENDETPEAEHTNEMIYKIRKQPKFLEFLTLCHKNYQIMNSQKA